MIDWKKEFADHVITRYYNDGKDIEHLEFRKPGTGIYSIRFTLVKKWTMLVCGDCGYAVYQSHGETTLAEMANSDLHYFSQLCVASPTGREFYDWNSDKIKRYIKNDILEERLIGDFEEDREDEGSDDDREELTKRIIKHIGDAVNGETEWKQWLDANIDWWQALHQCENSSDVQKLLDGDVGMSKEIYGTYYEDFDLGKEIASGCLQHLTALQMAVAQLKKLGGSNDYTWER